MKISGINNSEFGIKTNKQYCRSFRGKTFVSLPDSFNSHFYTKHFYTKISFKSHSSEEEKNKEIQRLIKLSKQISNLHRIDGFSEAVIRTSFGVFGKMNIDFVEDFCDVMEAKGALPLKIDNLPNKYCGLIKSNPDKSKEKDYKSAIRKISGVTGFHFAKFPLLIKKVFNPVTGKFDSDSADKLFEFSKTGIGYIYSNEEPGKDEDFYNEILLKHTDNYFNTFRIKETGRLSKDAPSPDEYFKEIYPKGIQDYDD